MVLAVGKKRPRKAPPIRRAPVPERDWVTAICLESNQGWFIDPTKTQRTGLTDPAFNGTLLVP